MRLVAIDTETTGLPMHPSVSLDRQPRIIEFAARVVTEDGLEDESMEFLCDPGRPLEPIITKITGLTDKDLVDQEDFSFYLPHIAKFLSRADGIVAHNLPFDSMMVWMEILRAEWQYKWKWPKIRVCTTQLFEPMFGYRPKLINLYEYITGEKYQQTHRALDDADALAKIIHQGGVIETLKFSPTQVEDGIYIPPNLRSH